jgi:hypothetical protein
VAAERGWREGIKPTLWDGWRKQDRHLLATLEGLSFGLEVIPFGEKWGWVCAFPG